MKRTCFRRFSFSLFGLRNISIRWPSDPHLKYLRGVRYVRLLSLTPAVRDFYFYLLWGSSGPITLLKMDAEPWSLDRFLSTEVSNFWVSPIFPETVDWRLMKTCKLPLCPLAGDTTIPTIRIGELAPEDLTACGVYPGVLPSLTVRLTFLGVWRTRALLRAAARCCKPRLWWLPLSYALRAYEDSQYKSK